MRKTSKWIVCALALSMLGACGTTASDRALSGAGIGAATGAVGSAVTGGDAATGAVVGGAAGAAVGALTSPNDVYLGKAPWRH